MNETTRTNTRHKKPQTEDTHTTKSFVTIPFSLFSDYKPAAVPAAQQALVQVPAITPVLLPKVVDVTAITGQQINGPVTSWQTPDGPFNVEHLAGMSPNGDLLVFFWSPRQDWTAVNVSQITGQKIVSPVTSWVINNVEHLAGYASDSSLYSFFWSSDRNWQAVNLSLMTGQKVTTPVTNWQTPDGPRIVEHLAGRSQDGHLLVFFWSPGGIYTVHIQAVKVADDDGGRETSITADQVKQWIHKANEVYAVGGIQFLFNPNGPNADWLPVLRNTLINKMYGEDAPDWIQSRDEANAVAARYSDKMTIFFRYGPGPGPTGGGFSSTTYNFVAMPGFSVTVVCGHQNLGLLAHESGHYMGLSHTFRFIFGSIAEAEGYFSSHNNDPASFDGDGLSDTPPDPFINTPDIACQHTISITLTGVQLVLPRNNIMSYYDEEGKTISPQQINIVRQTLDSRAQNNGLSIGKP